jgi:hypothetical protein
MGRGKSKKPRPLSWDTTKLKEAIDNSTCMIDVCRYLDIPYRGRTNNTVRYQASLQGLSLDHFDSKKAQMRGILAYHAGRSYTQDEVLIINSECDATTVKRWARKIIPSTNCNICNIQPQWNGKQLTLQLDHINGNTKDNRVENLRWICPNCHSQTDTYCGKKSWKKKASELNPNWRKEPRINTRKVDRPTREELEILIQHNSWVSLGKRYGLTDTSIKKWAKAYGLI